MNMRQNKQAILSLVADTGLSLAELLTRLAAYPAQAAVHALFSALCRPEALLRWRGVSCMGATLARLADADMEAARIVMRRLLWSLNDESGGIGWGAPESMAEAMCRHRGLALEYAHMLLSYLREDGAEPWQDGNYLEHPLLQQGVLWGLARLSGCRQALLVQRGAGPELLPFLAAPEAIARALACIALGNLGLETAQAALQSLAGDRAPVRLYTAEGAFVQTSVGACATGAMERI